MTSTIERPTRTPVLTERDLRGMRWLAEQGAADLRQVTTVLTRGGAPVSMQRAYFLVGRWEVLGLAEKKKMLADRATVVALTKAGMDLVGASGKAGMPGLNNLTHTLEVADVRLWCEEHNWVGDDAMWVAERELRAEQSSGPGGIAGRVSGHTPDAEMRKHDGTVAAVEVELTSKSKQRLDLILVQLAQGYSHVAYFARPESKRAVEAARDRMPDNLRQKVSVQAIPTPTYGMKESVA